MTPSTSDKKLICKPTVRRSAAVMLFCPCLYASRNVSSWIICVWLICGLDDRMTLMFPSGPLAARNTRVRVSRVSAKKSMLGRNEAT